jgi:hypothetical protein
MEGHWIGRIVVPCHEVVFEGCIDQWLHKLVCRGN